MLKSISVGAELFRNLIENNCYYVDKTPFIRTVFQDNQSDVMLITRPRRFGKTLTMSTFYDFLSLDSRYLNFSAVDNMINASSLKAY